MGSPTAAQQSPPRFESEPVGGNLALVRRRLLIAADEPLMREQLTRTLTGAGYEVIGQASSGPQAAEMAAALRPDVVILDTRLLDGETGPAAVMAPMVLLGTLPDSNDITAAVNAGAMGLVRKPFTVSRLIPAMEMAVGRHADAAGLRARVIDITGRLESRNLVKRAKAILMSRQNIAEPTAYRWMQKSAMDRRMSMEAIATEVIKESAE
jgi:AmiR/NasT family two-component response regulator